MEEPEVRARNPSKYPAVGFLLKFTPAKDVDYRSQTPLVRLPGSQVQIAPDGQAAVLYGSNSPLTEPLPNQADIEVDVAAGEWSTDKPITTRAGRAGNGAPVSADRSDAGRARYHSFRTATESKRG